MKTINLKIKDRFYIEQCNDCFGLFFDDGELEYLLEKSVSNVFSINYQQLYKLQLQRSIDYGVQYIKCPVCQKLMQRINFGSMSGVIVDRCKEHGTWLDGGELKMLTEWVKAGGKMYHQQKMEELKKQKEAPEKLKEKNRQLKTDFHPLDPGHRQFEPGQSIFAEDDLLGLLIRFVGRLILKI
jgi:Zn-finger nucleic acid-binding protein